MRSPFLGCAQPFSLASRETIMQMTREGINDAPLLSHSLSEYTDDDGWLVKDIAGNPVAQVDGEQVTLLEKTA